MAKLVETGFDPPGAFWVVPWSVGRGISGQVDSVRENEEAVQRIMMRVIVRDC